jgi:hypothetical protein
LTTCLLSPCREDADASPSLAIKQICDLVADPSSVITWLAETDRHASKPSFEEVQLDRSQYVLRAGADAIAREY